MIKRNLISFLVIGFLSVVFLGCGQSYDQFQKMVPQAADQFAVEYIHALQKKDLQWADLLINPGVKNEKVMEEIGKISNFLASKDIQSMEMVGFNIVASGPGQVRYNLSYQIQFADNTYALMNVGLDDVNGSKQIFASQVNAIPASINQINSFGLVGKSVYHYLMLLLLVAVVAAILAAEFLCVKTPLKHWWMNVLWGVIILFGVCTLSINWTNGQLFLTPLSLLPMGIRIGKNVYAPYVLSAAFPLGAVIFLILRQKLVEWNRK